MKKDIPSVQEPPVKQEPSIKISTPVEKKPLFEGVSLEELSKRKSRRTGSAIRHWFNSNPTRMVTLSFLAVILTGTLLLCLPVSSAEGTPTAFLTALFTSTSATCVTGLILQDTATSWSGFGEFVIMNLIQIGGLSLLTILSAFGLGLHRRMNLGTTRALQDTTAGSGFQDTFSLVRRVILVTAVCELTGALLLFSRFVGHMTVRQALWKSLFHAVSSFCNAGFDLMGDITGPYSSLSSFNADPLILPTSALLLIGGGLGFVVWDDIVNLRRDHQLQFHSRLVLGLTAFLLGFGTLYFFFFEGPTLITPDGSKTLGDLPFMQRLNAAFFQSATLRTAGYNSIDQGSLSDTGKIIGAILMLIGGGPASTAGGIKVTTLAVVLSGVLSDFKGLGEEAHLFRHRIKQDLIRRAFSVFMMGLGIVILISLALSLDPQIRANPDIRYPDLVYEAASAFGTVGVSSMGTSNAGTLSRILLITTMYIGRVGPASLALSFIAKKPMPARRIYPEGRTFVG